MSEGYDIIGDIHGHADALHALLERMGYRERRGAYRHPSRKALFVGDFIDRGPQQLETVRTIRKMIDAGSAQAVMGNHELNAIAWHTPDPDTPGEFLRPHHSPKAGDKNFKQHEAFLAEVEGKPELHRELIEWFLSLPLWLELPEIRVVHACWHPEHMAFLSERLAPGKRLTPELMVDASRKTSPMFNAVDCLAKGVEVPLPNGACFEDKSGYVRHEARVRWWDPDATTYRNATIVPWRKRQRFPDTPIPSWARVRDPDPRPTFVGHYWQRGTPEPLSDRVACVDYSAGLGKPLVAYRWDGEPRLVSEKFARSR